MTASARGSSVREVTRVPVSILPAVAQIRGECRRDRPRPTSRHGPAEPVARADQSHADGRAHRPIEPAYGVGRDASERARLRSAPGMSKRGRRHRRSETETDEADRMLREVQERTEQVVVEDVERPEGRRTGAAMTPRRRQARAPSRPRREPSRRRCRRRADGPGRLRPAPLEPVALQAEGIQDGRTHRHRVHRGAVVVDETAASTHRYARRPRSPPQPRAPSHQPLAGEHGRAREPVRAGPDDDRVAQPTALGAALRSALRITSTGKSNDSSSHGPRRASPRRPPSLPPAGRRQRHRSGSAAAGCAPVGTRARPHEHRRR